MCLSIPHLAGGWGWLKTLTVTPMTCLLLNNNNNDIIIIRINIALHPRAYVRNEGGRGLRPAEETVRTEEHE